MTTTLQSCVLGLCDGDIDRVTETLIEGHFAFRNHFDYDDQRTTNVVEGWHHKLNRILRHLCVHRDAAEGTGHK